MNNVFRLISTVCAVAFLGACTNIKPIDVDDQAQKELWEQRDKKKAEAEAKKKAENEANAKKIAEENEKNKQKYYAALRAYKKTDHKLMFGWFSNWNPQSPDPVFNLDLLPDSVDFISNWGQQWDLSEAKKEQLKHAHERGIRMTIGWIIENVGQGINAPEGGWLQWKKEDGSVDVYKAIDVYVASLCDSIQKYNYDGMDIDYEPSFASPFKNGNHCGDWGKDGDGLLALISCSSSSNKERENYFFTELRKGFDELEKKMDKKLMLNINGSISWIDPQVAHLFDYFTAQSYNNSAGRWVNSLSRFGYGPEKLLVTETFQNKEGNANSFAKNYAVYANEKGIGGIGAFHINEDVIYGPNYKNVKEAIQVMNPANTYTPEE